MDIRPLRRGEVPALVEELWLPFAEEMADLDAYEALADGVDAAAEAIEHRRERLAADDGVDLVAEADDGSLAGYVAAEVRPTPPVFARGDACRVTGVYVRPADRGAGLGGRLLARAEAWGRERGCEHATLSVHPDNATARRLYDGRGYEPFRETRRREL